MLDPVEVTDDEFAAAESPGTADGTTVFRLKTRFVNPCHAGNTIMTSRIQEPPPPHSAWDPGIRPRANSSCGSPRPESEHDIIPRAVSAKPSFPKDGPGIFELLDHEGQTAFHSLAPGQVGLQGRRVDLAS